MDEGFSLAHEPNCTNTRVRLSFLEGYGILGRVAERETSTPGDVVEEVAGHVGEMCDDFRALRKSTL